MCTKVFQISSSLLEAIGRRYVSSFFCPLVVSIRMEWSLPDRHNSVMLYCGVSLVETGRQGKSGVGPGQVNYVSRGGPFCFIGSRETMSDLVPGRKASVNWRLCDFHLSAFEHFDAVGQFLSLPVFIDRDDLKMAACAFHLHR